MRLEQACSASSNVAASRKAWTRPCVGSCEVSMDALLRGVGQPLALSSHSRAVTIQCECLRAEARGLNLDRTPWNMTWGACDRSAPAVAFTRAVTGAAHVHVWLRGASRSATTEDGVRP